MSEYWEPSNYDGNGQPPEQPTPYERPEKWYRDNAAVFHTLEQWQKNWDDFSAEFESAHGMPPSSTNREKNKATFRRQLIESYGRGEPDGAWLDQRIGHLEKRGMAPERGDGGRR